MFRNVADASVARGAIQLSVLAFAHSPQFGLLQQVLSAACDRVVAVAQGRVDDPAVLATVYEAVNSAVGRQLEITLWGSPYRLVTFLLPRVRM